MAEHVNETVSVPVPGVTVAVDVKHDGDPLAGRHKSGYDVVRGGVQRTHRDSPGWCWEWARAGASRAVVAHLSVGRPVWWRPDAGRRQYAGITEWRAGWLLVAVQVACRDTAPAATSAVRAAGNPVVEQGAVR